VNFNDWLNSVPTEITGDTLWKMEAYRLALFASELGWHDVTRLMVTNAPSICPPNSIERLARSVHADLFENIPMP